MTGWGLAVHLILVIGLVVFAFFSVWMLNRAWLQIHEGDQMEIDALREYIGQMGDADEPFAGEGASTELDIN